MAWAIYTLGIVTEKTACALTTMSQSDIYNVFCIILGEGDPFLIEIQKSAPVGRLKQLIKEENSEFATIDSKFLDLYRVDIPDATREVLMARVLAESLDTPLLATHTLTDNFSTAPPKAATIHFIVKYSKLYG
jgi:hypothetical protein